MNLAFVIKSVVFLLNKDTETERDSMVQKFNLQNRSASQDISRLAFGIILPQSCLQMIVKEGHWYTYRLQFNGNIEQSLKINELKNLTV